MSTSIRKCWPALLLAVALLHGSAMAADGEPRRAKDKTTPVYPELARRMKLAGTVRIEVVIAANGTVKSTKALGGHPLLIQAATEAIKKWRYEPGPETTMVVAVNFHE